MMRTGPHINKPEKEFAKKVVEIVVEFQPGRPTHQPNNRLFEQVDSVIIQRPIQLYRNPLRMVFNKRSKRQPENDVVRN